MDLAYGGCPMSNEKLFLADNSSGSGKAAQEKREAGDVEEGTSPASQGAQVYANNSKTMIRHRQVWNDERVDAANMVAVLLAIATLMGDEDICEVSYPQLAALCRMSQRSVAKYVPQAEELGYFSRQPGVGHASTVYAAAGRWIM